MSPIKKKMMSVTLQNAIAKSRYKDALNKYLDNERNVLKCLAAKEDVVYDSEERLTVSEVVLYNLVRLAHEEGGDLINDHGPKLKTMSSFEALKNYINAHQTVVLPPNTIDVLMLTHRIALDMLTEEEQKSDPAHTALVFRQNRDFFMFLGNTLHQYVYGSVVISQLTLSYRLFKRLYEVTTSAGDALQKERDLIVHWKMMYDRMKVEATHWMRMYSNKLKDDDEQDDAMSTTPAPNPEQELPPGGAPAPVSHPVNNIPTQQLPPTMQQHLDMQAPEPPEPLNVQQDVPGPNPEQLGPHPRLQQPVIDIQQQVIDIQQHPSTIQQHQQSRDTQQEVLQRPIEYPVDQQHQRLTAEELAITQRAATDTDIYADDADEIDDDDTLNDTLWNWDIDNTNTPDLHQDLTTILSIVSMYRSICGLDFGSTGEEKQHLEKIIDATDPTKITFTKYFTVDSSPLAIGL